MSKHSQEYHMKINSLIISLILLALSNQAMAGWTLQSHKTVSVNTNKEGWTAYASTDFGKLEIGLRVTYKGGCPTKTIKRDTLSTPVLINGTLVKMNRACHITKTDFNNFMADLKRSQDYENRIKELESEQAYSAYYSMSSLPKTANYGRSIALSASEIKELSELKKKIYRINTTNYASVISYYPATSKGQEFLLGLMKKKDKVCIDDKCISSKGFSTSLDIINGTTKAI